MLLWPIFFVAASQQRPHLKPRNFKKAVTKGIGSIRLGDKAGSAKGGGFGGGGNDTDSSVTEKPHWENQEEQQVGATLEQDGM